MTNATILRRGLAAAAILGASILAPASAALALSPVDPHGPRIEVTSRDVELSNQKVAMAYSA